MQATIPTRPQPTGTTVASGIITVTATADVIGIQNPELTLVKSADRAEYTAPGEIINYILTVTNTGNVTITGITVSDPIVTVTCPGAPYTLVPGASRTCTAQYTVTAADVLAGSIINTADAAGTSPSAVPVDTISNTVTVVLRNLPPEISCPTPIVTSTSVTSCDILISGGLTATFDDPNGIGQITSLTWTMTGATAAVSPATGMNNITSYTFNLGVTTVTYTVTDALGLSDDLQLHGHCRG